MPRIMLKQEARGFQTVWALSGIAPKSKLILKRLASSLGVWADLILLA